MHLSPLPKILGILSLLYAFATSSPTPIQKRDTAELYIFANCFNNKTHASYAAIFWYYPDFLPDYPEPQLTGYVNNHTAICYAGRTTQVKYPFTLTAKLPLNATTATRGTLVSIDVSASSFAGPMAAFRGSEALFYTPSAHVNCYEEYYQQDVS